MSLQERLVGFVASDGFRGKGPLCVALVITDHAREFGLPLDPAKLLTEGGGQVLGLGKAKVQSVLNRHGLKRVLAEEGGRTSRGSIGNMQSYVGFLNTLAAEKAADLDEIEAFWISNVRQFFEGKPFMLKVDASDGIQAVMGDLIDQAIARQKSLPGTMFAGAVMQHLVGAKLQYLHGSGVKHHSSSTKDADRPGDFEIGDVVVHVTISPGEALIRKCSSNLSSGQKPIIITYKDKVAVAAGLAEPAGIGRRVDILDFTQFMASNVHELGKFNSEGRREHLTKILAVYNEIIESVETDPSLRIEIAKWG